MEINGLPLHPLVVHAAVILIPLAALVAIVFAVMPKWRWATRWPMVASALVALGAMLAAYFSGKSFYDGRLAAQSLQKTSTITLHEERAEVLLWVTIVFVVVVLATAWGLGGPSGLSSGKGARGTHAPLIERSLLAMTLIFAVAVILMTAATGDAGARSVWGGVQF